MLKMLSTPSKIVLLVFTLTVCAAFLLGNLETKEFMILAGMVFAFYFTKTNMNGTED